MQPLSTVCGPVGLAALLASIAVSAAPTVTIVEGPGSVVSGAAAYIATPGMRLQTCDIVRTGAQAIVQLEDEDGGQILIGPDSLFVVDLPQGGEGVVGPHFLISGWAKVTAPKRPKPLPYQINSPHFEVSTPAGVVALRVGTDGGEFFVELGDATATAASARTAVTAGHLYARKAGSGRGALADNLKNAFVQAMPRAFRDTLPTRLAVVKANNPRPRPAPDYNPSDAQGWLRSAPELQACVVSDAVRAAQQMLSKNGFDVGPIDGILGRRTGAALRDFQQQQQLTQTGKLDADTLRALDALGRR
ncbi:MAG TPA: peptidoglycan-binding protein [Burkholderiaceae bacterium]|nr:peptidoglycan-binding protein [Burkholderiaceae bacterium]